MKILALDMSSTTIGACYNGTEFETINLKGDIAQRCELAARLVGGWILIWRDIDFVIIEAPFIHPKRPSGVIPQARVSGAVLAEVTRRELTWMELTPSEVKKALTGSGVADKRQMISAAPIGCNEHEADAYGLWLAGKAIKVESRAA